MAAFAIAAKCKTHSLSAMPSQDRAALVTWLAGHSNVHRGNDYAFFCSLEVYGQRVGMVFPGCTWGFLNTLYNHGPGLPEGHGMPLYSDDFRQDGSDIDIPAPQDWPYVSSDEEQ